MRPTQSGRSPLGCAWEPYLSAHPDRALADYLRRGFGSGFRISFAGSLLRSSRRNMASVARNPQVVDSFIEEECRAGRMVSSVDPAGIHISPMGLVPKSNRPGQFRLVVDLSSPAGGSVNDGIDSDLCSLSYTSVSHAVRLVQACGVGALMAKLDLKSAYRMVPVHQDDHHLLGIQWRGVVYYDKALPFGLRSAPKIFTAVADALAWAMTLRGITYLLHYLDDFFFCSPPGSPACQQALQIAIPLCSELGFPTAPEKTFGPATIITFLGIEIDSVRQELRLPQDKLVRLQALMGPLDGMQLNKFFWDTLTMQ